MSEGQMVRIISGPMAANTCRKDGLPISFLVLSRSTVGDQLSFFWNVGKAVNLFGVFISAES
jgi:hypothetical protein